MKKNKHNSFIGQQFIPQLSKEIIDSFSVNSEPPSIIGKGITDWAHEQRKNQDFMEQNTASIFQSLKNDLENLKQQSERLKFFMDEIDSTLFLNK